MGRSNHQSGYSILELVLVLAITALIAHVSYPRIQELRESVLLSSEAARVSSILQSLATAALSTESEVVAEAVGTTLRVTQGASSRVYTLRAPVQFSSPSSIVYHPTGAVPPRTLVLTKASARCEIIISLRGRVRVAC